MKRHTSVASSVFKSTLKEVVETGCMKGKSPYSWNKANTILPELHELLKTISQKPTTFSSDVVKPIQLYPPDSLQLNACAWFYIEG